MRIFYTITLFLSSALLFLVQPMIAKMILPRFGGSPAVWNTSMVFFQAMLLLGYLYDLTSRWLGPRRQAILHSVLLFVPLIVLPIAIPRGWAPTGASNPAPLVLALLGLSVGIPFFVLSAGAPVLQRWFADTDDKDAKDPYFLYSASNLGSMIALLGYPFLLEPTLRLSEQSRVWSFGYYLLVAMMLACAVVLWRRPVAQGSGLPLPPQGPEAQPGERVGSPLYWIALAFVPSSLLLGLTTYLTTNIAPVPLLWVVPLALYLFTFILAFAKRPKAPVALLARILPLIVTPLALVIILEATQPLGLLAPMHVIAFFVAALMCHGMLAQSRPAPARLTEFYLWISVGGVLGGIFNALVAPLIFKTLAEYPLALVLACLLRPRAESAPPVGRWDWIYPVLVTALTAGLVLGYRATGGEANAVRTAVTIGVPAVLCFLAVDRPLRFALALGGFFLVSGFLQSASDGRIIDDERSFFGVHRILEGGNGSFRKLVHGTTVHGEQRTDPTQKGIPLTYYYESGPIGQVFDSLKPRHQAPSIALIGLGVGSLAAYGQPGQRMVYFEIDPVVAHIAEDARYFTFLHDSKANVTVVLGDGRLSLAKEANGSFGVIVLDAFTSDAIPVHLLTKEAMQMYVQKLQPGGLLAFHVSNQFLDLEPVLAKTAQSIGLVTLSQDESGTVLSADEKRLGKEPSHWLLMARSRADLGPLARDPRWDPPHISAGTPVWTDDYSNILGALDPKRLLGRSGD